MLWEDQGRGGVQRSFSLADFFSEILYKARKYPPLPNAQKQRCFTEGRRLLYFSLVPPPVQSISSWLPHLCLCTTVPRSVAGLEAEQAELRVLRLQIAKDQEECEIMRREAERVLHEAHDEQCRVMADSGVVNAELVGTKQQVCGDPPEPHDWG